MVVRCEEERSDIADGAGFVLEGGTDGLLTVIGAGAVSAGGLAGLAEVAGTATGRADGTGRSVWRSVGERTGGTALLVV